VHFVLEYSGLQTTVLFAHIHVAQPNVNGTNNRARSCAGNSWPRAPENALKYPVLTD